MEVIIVDDASSDNSVSIAKAFCSVDSRFRLLELQTSRGAGLARRYGAEQSKGSYLHFVDSDDLVRPGIYNRVIPALKDSGCELGVFRFSRFLGPDSPAWPDNQGPGKPLSSVIRKSNEIGPHVFLVTNPSLWNKVWDRDLFMEEVRSFDETLAWADDVPFTYSGLTRATSVQFFRETFYDYRQFVENSQTSSATDSPDAILHSLTKLHDRLISSGRMAKVRPGYNSFVVVQLHQTLSSLRPEIREFFFDQAKDFVAGMQAGFDGTERISFLTPRSSQYFHHLANDSFGTFNQFLTARRLNPYPRRFSSERLMAKRMVPWSMLELTKN